MRFLRRSTIAFAIMGMVALASLPAGAASKPAIKPANSVGQVLQAVKAAQSASTLPKTLTPAILEAAANDAPSVWALNNCDPDYGTTSVKNLSPCTFGAKKYKHTMVIIGDSNAAMWEPAFDLMGKRLGWRVIDLTKNNCGPAALTYYLYPESRTFTECNAWQSWRMKTINKLDPSIVVMAAYIGGNTGPSVPLTPALWQQGLQKTIGELKAGIQTVILSEVPHITVNGPQCLAKNPTNIKTCAQPASVVVDANDNSAEAAAATATGQTYLNVTNWFCAQTCPDEIGGVNVYSGIYHITHDYATYLSKVMQLALARNLAKA